MPYYGRHHLRYTNWELKICPWRLYFWSWSPKGGLRIFLISSPALSLTKFTYVRKITIFTVFTIIPDLLICQGSPRVCPLCHFDLWDKKIRAKQLEDWDQAKIISIDPWHPRQYKFEFSFSLSGMIVQHRRKTTKFNTLQLYYLLVCYLLTLKYLKLVYNKQKDY